MAPTLTGGQGDDTYVIDNINDVVNEQVNGGMDTAVVARSVDLLSDFGISIENVTLAGTGAFFVIGTDRDNRLTGNAGANSLTGGDGNDVLDGKGGADTMIGGGAGDDTYFIDSLRDHITDTEGANVLFSTVGLDLTQSDFSAITDVTLLGNARLAVQGSARGDNVTGNAGANLLHGDDGNDTLAGAGGDDQIIGGNGDDSLQGGDGNDNLIGDDGNDLVAGGAGDDTLSGGRGDDTLEGGAGADTLSGGSGDDVYLNVDALDVIAETADGGYDTARSNGSIVLGDGAFSIEAVELLGAGNTTAIGSADANTIRGNVGDNLLEGRDGNDSLDGGAGADSLVGGSGNDTYVWAGDIGDVVVELADDGTDTIQTAATLSLIDFANVENATLIGTDDATLTGTAIANVLTGNAGNNLLDGAAGVDTMNGGAGNDTYMVDDTGDQVTDTGGSVDVVRTSVDFVAPDGVEQIEALGSADVALTGNGASNRLTGNSGNNRLDAGAGGVDTLIGGLGDDTYLVTRQSFDMQIVENPEGGTDTIVVADGNFSLSGFDSLANIENIISTSTSFTVLIGNAAPNRLVGGNGDNVIAGGSGDDTMIGGAGNDTYYVDDPGDEVVELPTGGNSDEVWVNRNFDASIGFLEIENFTLTGSANLTLTGNDSGNRLFGNEGNNLIVGGAGADVLDGGIGGGDDTLQGGNGNDTLNGSLGNDRIDGGADNDILIFDPDDIVLVDGGSGFDTLRFSFADQTLNLNLPGAIGVGGVYRSIEALDLTGTGNNSVTDLGWQQILTLSDDDRLIVDGTAGDTVTSLAGQAWVQGADQTIGINLYNTWTSHGATLLIDTDVTFTPL